MATGSDEPPPSSGWNWFQLAQLVAAWELVGLGWLSTGDAALAASAAARAREHRDLARDRHTTDYDADHD